MKLKFLLFSTMLVSALGVNAQSAWHQQNSGLTTVSRGINDFDVVDSNIVWAVGYDGRQNPQTLREYTKTTNGGATWVPGIVNGTGLNANFGLANISAIDADTAYASIYPATASIGLQGVYKTTNGGSNWTKVSAGTFTAAASFINVVHFFDAQHGVAIGDPLGGYFEAYTTSNYGHTWTRVPQANINFAPLAADEYGTVGYFDAHDSTIIYPTNYGRLLVSKDMGVTWALGESIVNGIASTTIPSLSFKDKNHVYAVISNATANINTIMESLDGGLTWTDTGNDTIGGIYNIHAVEFVPGTTSTIFAVAVNYVSGGLGSAYSEDGGVTWIPIDKEQHTALQFNDINNGWSGDFSLAGGTEGIFKWGSVRTATGVSASKVEEFSVYPNPTNSSFYVRAKVTGASSIKVMDVTGRIVFEQTYPTQSLLLTSVDMSAQAKGVYMVEVKEGSKVSVQKVIVR